MFREIYELINSNDLFNGGMEIEVLKGFNQHIPYYRIDKKLYRKIRLSNYKNIK